MHSYGAPPSVLLSLPLTSRKEQPQGEERWMNMVVFGHHDTNIYEKIESIGSGSSTYIFSSNRERKKEF